MPLHLSQTIEAYQWFCQDSQKSSIKLYDIVKKDKICRCSAKHPLESCSTQSQWVLVALVTVFCSIWDKIVFANLHNGVWRVLTLLLTPTMNKHCSGSNLVVLCFYSLAEQSHGASSTITDDRILFRGQFLCLSHLLPLNPPHDTRSYRPATTFI